MLEIETIYSGNGPLPQKGTFNTDIDGLALLLVSGTAFSQSEGMMGIGVLIDGVYEVAATLYSNWPGSHATLVSGFLLVNLAPGQHTYVIQANPNTDADQNDVVSVSLWPVADKPFYWNFAGPLPASTNFTSYADGQALVFLQGSAWIPSFSQDVGLIVTLDGNQVLTSQSYINDSVRHQALPAVMGPVTLTSGPHQIGVSQTSPFFSTDGNDVYTVVVIF
jgi:hypothetical protein